MKMDDPSAAKRREAVQALAKIALVEGVVLVAVVAAYFWTGEVWVLFAGFAASMALFAPMFLRWTREHRDALKAKPISVEQGDG